MKGASRAPPSEAAERASVNRTLSPASCRASKTGLGQPLSFLTRVPPPQSPTASRWTSRLKRDRSSPGRLRRAPYSGACSRTWNRGAIEADDSFRVDLDRLAGLGVPAGARLSLRDPEGPEADERHLVSLAQRPLDTADEGFDRLRGRRLRDASLARDAVDEFGLVHSITS